MEEYTGQRPLQPLLSIIYYYIKFLLWLVGYSITVRLEKKVHRIQ